MSRQFVQVERAKIERFLDVVIGSRELDGEAEEVERELRAAVGWDREDDDGVVRVDRAALVAAAETIRKHEKLLIAAFDDQHNQNMKPNEAPGYEVIYGTMRALAHVIHDDFRSSETRGGS